MRLLVIGGLVLVGLVVGTAEAQTPPPVKPGLWQVHSEREIEGQKARMPDMSERMKNLPPEARKQMEEMMKARGVDMGGMTGNDMKICLSKDSVDPANWQRQQGTCKTDYLSRTGTVWKWHTSCREPAAETDGEAHFTGPDSYTVKTATTMTIQGETRTTRMTLNSKYLGPDCGDLKPIAPPRQ